MVKSKSLPKHALRVKSYSELEQFARAFVVGHLNLLILCGDPGIGKSQCFRRAVGKDVCWIDGNATAFGIYTQAYEHRDRPIVLDDVDGLFKDRNGVRLLKCLCQTDREKSVCWNSKAVGEDIPRQFTTTSQVVIIANEWRSMNVDVSALEDRGHLLSFEPTALEIHRRASDWFWDQEVFDFVADHLHLMTRHSLRTYILAHELKQAGLDWQLGVLGRCLSGTTLTVARLKADPTFVSEEERSIAFIKSGNGCRATYFNHARKLLALDQKLALKLNQTSPLVKSETQPANVDNMYFRRKLQEGS